MNSINKYLTVLNSMWRGRLPGQLVIQYTNQCNANCPQCGMRRTERIVRTTLEKEHVKSLIDTVAVRGVKALSFTGGEPLMYLDDIVELIDHASKAGIPYIRTGTNGFMFRDSNSPYFDDRISVIAEKLASTKLYTFWISIDSASPSEHEKIRGLSGVIKGIEKAVPIFHKHGIYPSVNLGINRATGGGTQPFLNQTTADDFQQQFESSFERFYQFVYDLGFTIVNACYPMSSEKSDTVTGSIPGEIDSTLYGAASADDVINFSAQEKVLIFTALFDTIPKFRDKLRIFSPRCSLYGLIRKFTRNEPSLFPCRGGIDFFFVECENGTIHPCGYRMEHQTAFPDLGQRSRDVYNCDKCEWECFRDPSDILGPFADLFSHPIKLTGKVMKEPRFFKLLIQDLRYYRACEFFNGRHAPQFQAMKPFYDQ